MSQNKVYNGSYKELLKLSIPLMLTWMSTTSMMLVDRLFLSHYSLEALGAAVNAGTFAWGLAYGFQIFAEMSQVVIAQYRGAGKEEKIPYPVWQMLWLVLFSIPLYIPLAVYGGPFIFGAGSLQSEYFMWFLVFGSVFGLIGAGSAYFIGRGENRIVTITAVVGNLVNLVLDYFMIFGIKGVLAPMGVKGAAIATGIGMSVQGIILLVLFLRRTGFKVLPFDFKELKPCLRAGVPPSIFMSVEIVGWGIFFSMMAQAGNTHLTVTSLCHCLLPFLSCVGIGLQKTVSTISGNWIGAGKMDRIHGLLQKAVVVLSLYMLIVGFIVYLFPNLIVLIFQNKSLDTELYELLKTGFMLSVAYLFFGGIRNIITGVLSAAGDSRFLTVLGSLSIWLFFLSPVYYYVILNDKSVTFAQTLLFGYGVIVSIIYLLRFRFGNWAEKASLIKE